MITAWRISNFKSYRGDHSIPLSGINVIAGANSSGKSTLIQSMLAIKQTIQFGPSNKPLLLNGPLTRLGSFSDVLNSNPDEPSISIGFDCRFSLEEVESLRNETDRSALWLLTRNKSDDYLNGLSLTSSWVASSSADDIGSYQAVLNPSLASSHLGISRSSAITQFATVKAWTDGESITPFDIALDPLSIEEISKGKPDAKVIGGYTDHFLPRYAAIDFSAAAKRAHDIAQAMFSGSYPLLSNSTGDSVKLSERVISAVSPWLEAHGLPVEALRSQGEVTVQRFRDLVKSRIDRVNVPMLGLRLQSASDQGNARAEIDRTISLVSSILAEEFPEERSIEVGGPANLRDAASMVDSLFTGAMKYLGPLRNPPRPVYQLEALPSSTDVGFTGEHTAAVLDLNRNKRVSYFAPPVEGFEEDYFSYARKKVASLHDAVVEWLSYLGVAEEVITSDEGVFGNRLRVQTSGSTTLHDLTNVGVGVSQVLPIIVLALLAPQSAFIILEQPELHLHPKVQARLADFLISLSLDGKQTLAETHSEYLIDRLRLRVALSDTDLAREAINIMFSVKKAGETTLQSIELTEFGSVVNWPADFFDQSQGDISRILRAAATKRKRKSA